MKEISVYRIDYEMKSKADDNAPKLWTACIAAYDQKKAVDFLAGFLKRTFKVTQLSRECGLHAMTDEIRQKVIDAYLEETKETVGEVVDESTIAKKEKEPKGRGRTLAKK